MPELPEVETVARGLQSQISGRRIVSVTLGKTDFIDNPRVIEKQLPGRQIVSVKRYGKFMLLRLSAGSAGEKEAGESALLVHLGMTGMLVPQAVEKPHEKHTHVMMLLDDGRELRYVDPRRFGRIAYLAPKALQKELLRFGADPLEVEMEEFVRSFGSRKARVKALLLDQGVLRGVGNIYADESLWQARIHPARRARSVKRDELVELYAALQKILRQAIALRGSSISDFLDADGLPGEYQQHHKAYGREGEACYRCGTAMRRAIVAGRSSFFCPNCQKAERSSKKAIKKQARKKRVG